MSQMTPLKTIERNLFQLFSDNLTIALDFWTFDIA